MKTVIVCSLNDPAGTNIKERLLEEYPFQESGQWFDSSPLYSWNDKTIASSRKDIAFVDNLDETFGECHYVFISRHRAESGIPSLTAHFTGNCGPASFGGNPGEIARYSPGLLKNYILELNSLRGEIDSNYLITLEATHHGPTSLRSPVLFVELGSTEKEWRDVETAKPIAKAIVKSIDSPKQYSKCSVAIGGTHYPEKLNKLIVESDVSIGPIVPKYALEYFNKSIFHQILSKSDQRITSVLIDRKGLGRYKQAVFEALNDTDLETISN